MTWQRLCWCAGVGAKCEHVPYVLQGCPPPPSPPAPWRTALAEVERLIYSPAGEACLDFFNLKSQSPSPSISYSPLSTCPPTSAAPPAVCEDIRAVDPAPRELKRASHVCHIGTRPAFGGLSSRLWKCARVCVNGYVGKSCFFHFYHVFFFEGYEKWKENVSDFFIFVWVTHAHTHTHTHTHTHLLFFSCQHNYSVTSKYPESAAFAPFLPPGKVHRLHRELCGFRQEAKNKITYDRSILLLSG